MSEPMSDTTTDAPPPDLETKNLPVGYGHAGVPVPDQLGYQTATEAASTPEGAEVTPSEPPDVVEANVETGEQGDAGNGTADAGAAPDADAGATTPTA